MKFHIIIGETASSLEKIAADDLKCDIEKVILYSQAKILTFNPSISLPDEGIPIIIGSIETNSLVKKLADEGQIEVSLEKPGKRGGIIQIIPNIDENNTQEMIILAGSDSQGTQYMVYEFSQKELWIDPFEYWTDIPPKPMKELDFHTIKPRVIQPPLVPILAYFDNDNDELANISEPYLEFSFEHWQEIISSLVRLKYNAIDLHDHFGRSEFYRWNHYKKLRPGYKPNTKLLEQIMNYAHERGVMIQISFYLQWSFKQISDTAAKNYFDHKQEWLDVWTYYLKETPIGKCDIFLNRPRDQLWDSRYKGKGKGNDAPTVFNDAFPEMVKILKEHNPNSIIIGDLYSEGRDAFKKGFAPEPKEDYIMAWPDNGFGKIDYFPEDQKGYKFGIYMHAGFFLNHVVQNPHVRRLYKYMKAGLVDHKMTHYCLVNGQTFRHFILNLELCSKICENPETFDLEEFLVQWFTRYFDKDLVSDIITIMKLLRKAQPGRTGYIKVMNAVMAGELRIKLLKTLFFVPRSLINKIYDKVSKVANLPTNFLESNKNHLEEGLPIIKSLKETLKTINDENQNIFFHDFVELQFNLYYQLNQVGYHLEKFAKDAKNQRKYHYDEAVKWAKIHHETRLSGDKNPKWKGWYDPKTRRPNGGYFIIDKLEKSGKISVRDLR